MANSTNDVISIESSDSDSDCQIVEVIPSPPKRGKNNSRWQKKLSSKTQTRSREMTMHQLDKVVYEDRPSMSSASKGYARRPGVDLTAADCGLQGTNSKTDHLPDIEPNNADAVPHIDLEDPFSVRQYIADDSKAARISFPCLTQSVDCTQDPHFEDGDEDEDEDEHGQRSARSRSGSTATLDFSPERESYSDSDKNTHRMFGEASESAELTDTRDCTTVDADTMRMMLHNSGYLTPAEETSSERPDPCVLKMELQIEEKALEGDSSIGPISATLQPHKEASKSGQQLPQAGRWDSVVNVAAFKALPGPLFTRPKQTLDVVTYESMMEERAAAQEAK
ncbi:uncharacterized protein T069G_10286 [Trichoderma breve]|uniref:Uncharacterized protein n=1 Tax=Trichoderma breve TaxID=2034170 RepID=A0A9W9B769_9HYPO|nr:uncharacterized protein T069G_10286 [Trichoderma breve]KAJ4854728.1 hypothetical protein T069G_10286 [Trichoderma breve]